MRRLFILPIGRDRAIEAIREAPDGYSVTLAERGRNLEQNAKFHAQCTELAKSGREWMGKRRTASEWKVLLVSGHATATQQGAEMVPGLEGEFVNLRESTASMSRSRISSLIEYAQAFLERATT